MSWKGPIIGVRLVHALGRTIAISAIIFLSVVSHIDIRVSLERFQQPKLVSTGCGLKRGYDRDYAVRGSGIKRFVVSWRFSNWLVAGSRLQSNCNWPEVSMLLKSCTFLYFSTRKLQIWDIDSSEWACRYVKSTKYSKNQSVGSIEKSLVALVLFLLTVSITCYTVNFCSQWGLR